MPIPVLGLCRVDNRFSSVVLSVRRVRGTRGITITHLQRQEESISPAGHGFDKARVLGSIPECCTNLGDSGIDSVVEIYERVLGPDLTAELLPGN